MLPGGGVCDTSPQSLLAPNSDTASGFYINLPIGGVSTAIVVLTKWPADKQKERLSFWESLKQLDPVGFLIFAPFCIMLLLALQWGGTTYAWSSATVIGLFCGSIAALCVFIAWEHRMGYKAMMPLSMLRRRIVYSTCIVSILQMGGIQIFAYFLPVWFQVIKDASPALSGVYFLGTIGPQIIFAIVSGALGMFLLTPLKYKLTDRSLKTRVLPSILRRRQCHLGNWVRPHKHAHNLFKCRKIHRLSNLRRCGSWTDHATTNDSHPNCRSSLPAVRRNRSRRLHAIPRSRNLHRAWSDNIH